MIQKASSAANVWRYVCLSILVAGLVGLMVVGKLALRSMPRRADPADRAWPDKIRQAPLTVSMSTIGDFAEGNSWYLSVSSAGQAHLVIDTFPQRTTRLFTVSDQQLSALREALINERFFELADEYGEQVPDGSTCSLTVTVGDVTKSVEIHFLMNWIHRDKAKLREPSRAVRVGLLVRGWFDDAEAVDLRRYDHMVLEAAR
jgi:hypothetical protein